MKQKPDLTTELASFNAIRVETAISRQPFHRLSKKGIIAINIKEVDENGEVLIRWEVSHNSKYGQPGPLAFKIDTLIVNRRIEEAARPIPTLIRLGSLREIIAELGASNHDTDKVRKALGQNAGALISAKIVYRDVDGTLRKLEADFTRYSVIFTGEELPTGQKADAVYVNLHDMYLLVLNAAMTRPLDYDYLRALAPAPQRFYELLSYQMYAAIKNDRPRAKMTYSYYCTYAPQTRYLGWEQARKQMAKIHAPHKKSGYIAKVEFEQTADSEGRPDWIMLYTPGTKARAEFRAFAKRGGPALIEVEPKSMVPPATIPQSTQLHLELEASLPVTELTNRGVTRATADELEKNHPERIEQQLDVFDWLVERKDKRVEKSPAGYLVKSIEMNYAIPKGFVSKAERQAREEAKREENRQAAENRRLKHETEARERHERDLIATRWETMSQVEQDERMATALAQADAETLALTQGPMRKFGLTIVRDKFIRRLLITEGKLPPDSE
jgi:hypothetical protein